MSLAVERNPQPAPCFGLTGGIACGKSTVAGFFKELGARVIDADAIAHGLLAPRTPIYHEVVQSFGEAILNASGEIDRKRLGAVVFADPDKRRNLEALLHPRILEKQAEIAIQYHQADPYGVIIVEAALIFEAAASGHFQKTIATFCRPDQQIERLTAAGLSRADANARIASQMPVEEKCRRADFVIDCSGSLEETRRQVSALYPLLKQAVGQ